MNKVSERFQTISLDRRLHKTTPKCNPWIVTISIQRNKSAEYVYLWQNTCLFSPWRSKWQIEFVFAFRWQDKTPIYWGKYWSLMYSLFDYITYKFSLLGRPHPLPPEKKRFFPSPSPKNCLSTCILADISFYKISFLRNATKDWEKYRPNRELVSKT